MGRIYRRATLPDAQPKKKDNDYVRKRNVVVNFRVTPEEKRQIDARIEATGLSRSEFFIETCTNQSITVLGNLRFYDKVSAKIEELSHKIDANPNLADLEPQDRESILMILEILNSLYKAP